MPIYRLIMNLTPLNRLCQGMQGEIATLLIGLGCHLSTSNLARAAAAGIPTSASTSRCLLLQSLQSCAARSLRRGAVVDGRRDLRTLRGQKLSKYVTVAQKLMAETYMRPSAMQVVCGGLVHFSTFRRQLLGGLSLCWSFIESFNGRHTLSIWIKYV